MSAQEKVDMELADEIYEWLEPHATGKRRKYVHKEFEAEYPADIIKSTLNHMVERGWILYRGREVVCKSRN